MLGFAEVVDIDVGEDVSAVLALMLEAVEDVSVAVDLEAGAELGGPTPEGYRPGGIGFDFGFHLCVGDFWAQR